MLVIGADPGLDGGIAVLGLAGTSDRTEEAVYVRAMPTRVHFTGKGREIDVAELEKWLDGLRQPYSHRVTGKRLIEGVGLFVIERVGNMPKGGVKQGASGMFAFGDGFGLLRSVPARMGWPEDFPLPQQWQKLVLPAALRGSKKRGSITFASRRYPQVSLLKTEKCKVPHDGMADALCLMEYGRRVLASDQQSGE